MENEPLYWQRLIRQRISRRRFLEHGTAALALAGTFSPTELRIAAAAPTTSLFFRPIAPSQRDELVLPEGFTYDVVARWGDHINSRDTFGFNCDYTAYFPLRSASDSRKTAAILAVNHEYPDPYFVGGQTQGKKSREQVLAEMEAVGMSFVHIEQDGPDAPWKLVPDDLRAWRLTALSPALMTGPAARSRWVGGRRVVAGTLGNCSGCRTPWDTVLTCEENYQDFYGEHSLISDGQGGLKEELDFEKRKGEYRWHDVVPFDGETGFEPAEQLVIRPEHYGYVVEVDPYRPGSTPRKHSALGRFRHENVAMRALPEQKLACYMGDDRRSGHVYKFVSHGVYRPGRHHREDNLRLLKTGTLYVAQFNARGPADSAESQGTGKWIPISDAIGKMNPVTGLPFDAASVLVHTFPAANAVGGTPTDRPEDLEVHPHDGSVYIAFTNNEDRGVKHGYVVRLAEDHDHPDALTFTWDVFAYGGPTGVRPLESGQGFSSPDNMVFDAQGNLWIVTDIATDKISAEDRHPEFASFGNNGLFFSATTGPQAGRCYQFASMPVEAEGTGPTWGPDDRTLFLSVQHPGEDAASKGRPLSSHWPDGGDAVPKPSVVAIRGFRPSRNSTN